jgi:hypothetical protein
MKLSAEGGQAKPVAANATGFNPWKFTFVIKYKWSKNSFYLLFNGEYSYNYRCGLRGIEYVEKLTALDVDSCACFSQCRTID